VGSDVQRVQQRVRAGEFNTLFLEELGWDRAVLSFSVTLLEPGQRGLGRPDAAAPYVAPSALESHTFTLNAVAQKCGMTVFVCSPLPDGTIPNAPTRYRLQHRAMKVARENILVFANAANTRQVWQWVRRGADVPVHLCEHPFVLADNSEALAQRLRQIAVSIAEEESGRLTLVEILRRVSAAFYNRRPSKNRLPYVRVRLSDLSAEPLEDGLQSWLRYIYSVPRLGRWEEQRLAEALQKGDTDAKRRFIEANLYLVTEIAWKMTQESPTDRNLLPDLIQEGYFGLLGAVENFDLTLGHRFQTYAQFRIRQRIVRTIQDLSKTIYLPVYLHDWIAEVAPRYALEMDRLWHFLEREPTGSEIASRLRLTPAEQKRLFLLTDQVQSLSDPETALGFRRIVDEETTHCPFASSAKRALREEIMLALEDLTPRERDVILLRFGFQDGELKTLEEVGRELEVTRERVRQIESSALTKLRKRSRARRLREIIAY
jgi:RNA polymerase primary sigma factor